MTIFDLLFLSLLFAAIVTLIATIVTTIRGQRRRALTLLRNLVLCASAYIGIVYAVTALSQQAVHDLRDPQCNDDWCLEVDDVERTQTANNTNYDVTLRIFSRARRRAQRENIATDVYLVDSHWNRYDPILDGSEIPLNTLLQAGESVTTRRHFQLPNDALQVGLKIGHSTVIRICLIIGECDAFHKGPIVRLY